MKTCLNTDRLNVQNDRIYKHVHLNREIICMMLDYFYYWKQKCYVNHFCIILIIYINNILMNDRYCGTVHTELFFCPINFCALIIFLFRSLLYYDMQHTFYIN